MSLLVLLLFLFGSFLSSCVGSESDLPLRCDWYLTSCWWFHFVRSSYFWPLMCLYLRWLRHLLSGGRLLLRRMFEGLKPLKLCVIYCKERTWSANNKGDVNCELLVSWQVVNVTPVISGSDPAAVNESPLEPKRKHMNIPLRPDLFCLPRPSLFSLTAPCLSFPADRKWTPCPALVALSLSLCQSFTASPLEPNQSQERIMNPESYCTDAQLAVHH